MWPFYVLCLWKLWFSDQSFFNLFFKRPVVLILRVTIMPRSFLVKSKRAHSYHQPRGLEDDCTQLHTLLTHTCSGTVYLSHAMFFSNQCNIKVRNGSKLRHINLLKNCLLVYPKKSNQSCFWVPVTWNQWQQSMWRHAKDAPYFIVPVQS